MELTRADRAFQLVSGFRFGSTPISGYASQLTAAGVSLTPVTPKSTEVDLIEAMRSDG